LTFSIAHMEDNLGQTWMLAAGTQCDAFYTKKQLTIHARNFNILPYTPKTF
jgi:hypothetical protein